MKKPTRSMPDSLLSQQCFRQIQNDIVDGVLQPGEKLKVEPLKERLGVGASPVREALSRLVSAGLVVAEDNKGFRVSEISEEDLRDTFETFTNIENLAISLAIARGDAEWEARIVAELHKVGLLERQSRVADYDAWVEQNYQFHIALIAGCNSPLLLEIRRNLYIKYDRYCRIYDRIVQEPFTVDYHEHQEIAQAVLQRDVQKAQALISKHNLQGLEDAVQVFKINQLI